MADGVRRGAGRQRPGGTAGLHGHHRGSPRCNHRPHSCRHYDSWERQHDGQRIGLQHVTRACGACSLAVAQSIQQHDRQPGEARREFFEGLRRRRRCTTRRPERRTPGECCCRGRSPSRVVDGPVVAVPAYRSRSCHLRATDHRLDGSARVSSSALRIRTNGAASSLRRRHPRERFRHRLGVVLDGRFPVARLSLSVREDGIGRDRRSGATPRSVRARESVVLFRVGLDAGRSTLRCCGCRRARSYDFKLRSS